MTEHGEHFPNIWVAYEAGAAEKSAELTALGPCGKHPNACNTFDGLIQGSNGPHRCTVCAELATVTEERDALKARLDKLDSDPELSIFKLERQQDT